MKIHILLIFILIFTCQILTAQTIIPADTIDGKVWKTENSPYQIAGDLTIINLVIQPGVIIQFIDDFKFEVDGILKAEGFYSDSIFFQPTSGNSQGWRGIKFKSTSIASSISYCRIEGANNQGIFIEQSSPAISNCRIVQNNGDGILIKNAAIELKHCIIDYNIGNGVILNAGQITASNSIFARNNQAGVYSTNSADRIILINTVIADNQGTGVDCEQGELTIKNSIIYNNASQIFWQNQTPEVSYSDIQGSSVYPGYENINTDPNFVDRSSFVLSELSSCIDAGDTNTVFEDKYFPPSKGDKRNDMGAYGGPEANGWYPPLFFDPQFVDFGRVRRDSSKIITIKIYNYLNTGITVPNISIEGTNSQVFSINKEGFELDVSNSLDLQVTFTPDALEVFSSDLILQTQSNGDVSALLSGEGVVPEINVLEQKLDFQAVSLGTSATLDFHILNSGGDTLIVDLLSPSNTIFTLSAQSLKIDPDLSIDTLQITFTPDSPKTYQDSLIVIHNDPSRDEILVELSGIGIAPSISFNPDYSSNSFISGQTASIGFSISSSSPVDSAKLYIREGGKSQYTEKLLINQNDGIWTAQINATEITERGLEYYVQAFHGFNSTRYPENGENKPNSIQVDVPQVEYPESTKEGFYQMISVPLNTSDQDLKQMFLDDLGSYDNTKYRIFDYERGPGYIEISNMNKPLPPGKALWLITKNATKLDVSNAQSIRTDQDFMIQLKRGWNMIATPFAFPIDWNQISQSIVLRYYDGTDWPFVSVMEPFKGYAVYVAENTSIAIPPRENQSVIHLLKTNLPQPENSWRFQISAYSGSLIDQFNYGGAKELATSAIDQYDYPEPPPIGDFISLYFTSKEHTIGYSTDYRELGKDGYTFDFELTSNVDGQKTIDIQPENLPMYYDWTVISNETNVNYMKESIQTSLKQAHFTLVIGTTDYIDNAIKDYQPLPSNYKLEQNYPNPFNSSTFIKFQLPHSTRVTVEIINILGQNIKTLIQNEFKEAGHYQVEWNGRDYIEGNVSSGIYILHLKTEQFTRSIKMILQK